MSTDNATETIAHFIGLFHLAEEEMRNRLDYDVFHHSRSKTHLDPMAPGRAHDNHIYGPRGYDPEARDRLEARPDPQFSEPSLPSLPPPGLQPVEAGGVAPVLTPAPLFSETSLPTLAEVLEIPPPGGLSSITIQANLLSDRDAMNVEHAEIWFEAQGASLEALLDYAGTLQVFTPDTHDGSGPQPLSSQAAQSLVDDMAQASAAAATALPQAQLGSWSGETLAPITVNGQTAEALPEWSAPDAATEGEEEEEEKGSDEDAPQSEITTGGNTATNMQTVATGVVDAPVIAVMGETVQLDVISQVNVLQDDAEEPAEKPAQKPAEDSESDPAPRLAKTPETPEKTAVTPEKTTGHTPNEMTNAAAFHGLAPSEPLPEFGAGGLPGMVLLSILEGDLINYSWTEQLNIAFDDDAISVSKQGNAQFLSFGENQLTNIENLFSQGTLYDLIVVGGDMFTQYMISQTNLLLDSDLFLGKAAGMMPDSSGNSLTNIASITHTAPDTHGRLSKAQAKKLEDFGLDFPDATALQGLVNANVPGVAGVAGVVNVLQITGNLVNMHSLKQTNVVSDSDLVHLLDTIPGAKLQSGGNQLANHAKMVDPGISSKVVSGKPAYSDAALHQANLISGKEDSPMALASEAVAFLADGLTGAAAAHDFDIAGFMPDDAGAPNFDVLQTMLA